METLWQDIRQALRLMRMSPGFTIVAVLTLALAIGANTALFSVVNGVLLNPLPYPEASRVASLHERKLNFESGSISYSDFRDWQKQSTTFSAIAISRGYSFNLTGVGDPEHVRAELISSDFFRVFGVEPVIGRNFSRGEDEIGANPIALISASLWKRKFGSMESVLDKVMTLDGKNYTIVGVIPANFNLAIANFSPADVYVPIGQWNHPSLRLRGAGLGIHGVGRLRPGVTIEQARADLERVAHNLSAAYPDSNRGVSANVVPLKQEMVGDIEPVLLLLIGAVGFVLLIACANVTNLLLARSTLRSREFAIRTALGATEGRMVRQLLTESTVLALLGGGLGVMIAEWGTRGALGLLPAALPRSQEIAIDSKVLLFTLTVCVVSGLLFGLMPALRASRRDLNSTLKQGVATITGGHHRAQGAFVIAELAMAMVLLTGAGLMIRSLVRLWNVDPGFNPKNALTFNVSLPSFTTQSNPDAIRAAWRNFDRSVKSTNAVQSVSLVSGSFPMKDEDDGPFWIEGRQKPSSQRDMDTAIKFSVEPEYLDAMGIPLQRGRFFTAQDDEHSPLVVVIDDVFANKYFAGESPLGKRVYIDDFDPNPAEIVGVVGHVKEWGLAADDQQAVRAEIYMPFMQTGDTLMKLKPRGTRVVVRSVDSVPNLFDSIRRTNTELGGQHVIYAPESLDEIISASLATQRFSMALLGVFAVLAFILASVGIYGVISYVVGERTREMGIRRALGAEHGDILWLILRQSGTLTLAGVALGLMSSFALARVISGMLYGVGANDPLTLLAVATLLSMAALSASYIPARRAMKVDPMVALRYE